MFSFFRFLRKAFRCFGCIQVKKVKKPFALISHARTEIYWKSNCSDERKIQLKITYLNSLEWFISYKRKNNFPFQRAFVHRLSQLTACLLNTHWKVQSGKRKAYNKWQITLYWFLKWKDLLQYFVPITNRTWWSGWEINASFHLFN